MVAVPLAYLLIKRIKPFNRRVTRIVSMRTLLSWHMYAGIIGCLLAILHTGHKFNSALGIALTTITLLVVLSGFAGRYLLMQCSKTIREKRELLTQMETRYRQTAGELTKIPEQMAMLSSFSGMFSQTIGSMLFSHGRTGISAPGQLLTLAGSMADLEYSIKMHATFETAFKWCIKLHITLSFTFLILLSLHIWSGIHFGLRWFQ